MTTLTHSPSWAVVRLSVGKTSPDNASKSDRETKVFEGQLNFAEWRAWKFVSNAIPIAMRKQNSMTINDTSIYTAHSKPQLWSMKIATQ